MAERVSAGNARPVEDMRRLSRARRGARGLRYAAPDGRGRAGVHLRSVLHRGRCRLWCASLAARAGRCSGAAGQKAELRRLLCPRCSWRADQTHEGALGVGARRGQQRALRHIAAAAERVRLNALPLLRRRLLCKAAGRAAAGAAAAGAPLPRAAPGKQGGVLGMWEEVVEAGQAASPASNRPIVPPAGPAGRPYAGPARGQLRPVLLHPHPGRGGLSAGHLRRDSRHLCAGRCGPCASTPGLVGPLAHALPFRFPSAHWRVPGAAGLLPLSLRFRVPCSGARAQVARGGRPRGGRMRSARTRPSSSRACCTRRTRAARCRRACGR